MPEQAVIRFGRVDAPQNRAGGLFGIKFVFNRPAEGNRVCPDGRVPADLTDPDIVRAAE